MRKAISVLSIFLFFFFANTAVTAADEDGLDEYKEFMTGVIAKIRGKDRSFFTDSVDMNSIIDEMLTALGVRGTEKQKAKDEMSILSEKLGARFVSELPETVNPKLISLTRGRQNVFAIVRLFSGDEGMAYVKYHLSKDRSGQIKIVDWQDFSSGMLFSEVFTQAMMLVKPTQNILERFYDGVTGKAKEKSELMKAFIAVGKNDYKTYLDIYNTMDESLRGMKIFCVVAIQMSMASGNDDIYMWSMENLARYHDDDPAVALLLVDYYFLKNDLKKADEKMIQLQQKVGENDAAIWWFRAFIQQSIGDINKAVSFAEKSTRAEPDYEDAYWMLLDLYTLQKAFKKAAQTANLIENRFSYEIDDAQLGTYKEYAELVKSDAWKKQRQKN